MIGQFSGPWSPVRPAKISKLTLWQNCFVSYRQLFLTFIASKGLKLSFTLNRPFAAKPSRDLLFIKLWAATLRMPEMEKACRKHQNGQV